VPSPAEIAYREAMRSLDGQAQDLTSVRGHLSIVVSAAGIAAAFLGAQADGRGPAFWIAAGAFALIAVLTVLVYRPVDFPWGFDGFKLVADYVDPSPRPDPEFVMRELAIHAAENYEINKTTLDRLWRLQSWAFLLFVVEVIALLANLALEAK
jgi:hypothetical protein